ncbi:MAG: DMT family transporter [Gammaproteobacteria bacterium]
MNRSFFVGLIAVVTAVSVWGIQLPVAKDAFAVIDLYHLTSIRYAIPALIMLPVLALLEGRQSLSYRSVAVPAFVLGMIGMCGSPMLIMLGMAMSRAEHAAVIVALQPSIAAVTLWILRGLRPAIFTIGCMSLALLGVVLVVTKGNIIFVDSLRQLVGDVLIFIGAACWVVYTMGTSRLAGWSTWRITVLTMIPGAVATVIVTEILVFSGHIQTPSSAQLLEVGWEISYLTFIGVVFAILAWNFGNRRIGPQNSTLLMNLLPVSTFMFRAVQGYRFERIEIVGAALVVMALVANNLYLRAQHVRIRRVETTAE